MGDSGGVLMFAVLSFAPRLRPRLLAALVRLDDPRLPIAEINRRLGEEAVRLGFRRPSYERVRVLVHELRRLRRRRRAGPSTSSVLLDVVFRVRPPIALLDVGSAARLSMRSSARREASA